MMQIGTADPRRSLAKEESLLLEIEARFEHREEDMSWLAEDVDDLDLQEDDV